MMPLIPINLVNGFKDMLQSTMDNEGSNMDSAKKFAETYDKYAKDAMALAAKPVFTGVEKKVMETTIAPAFKAPGAAPVAATTILNAVMSYWLAPPVIFQAPPIVGMVTVVPGCAAMIPALTAVFLNLANTVDMAALQMGTIIDAATRTGIVTFTLPPPPIGPPPPSPIL